MSNDKKTSGYSQPSYTASTKRYCQILDLYNDAELIERYKQTHTPENSWPEISAGIREVGVLNMEIYISGNRLFMVVDTAEDFEWDSAFGRLATMDRQAEWEEYMSQFQIVEPGSTSSDKWTQMARIFKLL